MSRQPQALHAIVPVAQVWTYARFSSDRQHERSIEDQERECARLCDRLHLRPPSAQFRDFAKSGATLAGRTGLQDLLARAAEPASRSVRRVLAVESLDRLGRNLFDSFDIVRRLHREAGLRIVTSDGRDSDAASFKAMLLADSFVADVFLDNLRTHVRRGMEGRVLEGKRVGRLLFGRIVRRGRIVLDPSKVATIRRMFEMSASGASNRGIAAWLRNEGQVPDCTPEKVGFWLSHRGYLGEVSWDGKAVRREERLRVVPDELYERVQTAIRARDRAPGLHRQPGSNLVRGGALTRRHLLSGLFRCAECGDPIAVIAKPARGHAYGCPRAWRLRTCPGIGFVDGARFERAVVEEAIATVLDEHAVDYVVREVERRVRGAARGREGERRCLGRNLADARKRLQRCVEHVEAHGASATMQDRILELERRVKDLEGQVAALDRAAPAVTVLRATIDGYFKRTAETLRDTDPARVRAALERLLTEPKVRRIARGEYVASFRVAPLGVLRSIMLVGGSAGPTASTTTTSSQPYSASSPSTARWS